MTPSSSFDPANPFPTQNDFNLVIAQFSQPQAHAGGSQQDNGNGNGESSRQPHRRQGIPVGEEDNDRNNDELRDLMKRKEAMLSGWEYRNRAIHPIIPDKQVGWLVKRCKWVVSSTAQNRPGPEQDYTSRQWLKEGDEQHQDQSALQELEDLEDDQDQAEHPLGGKGKVDGLQQTEVIDIEFHVVYHQTYRIPQLLFSAEYADGTPLNLNDLLTTNLLHTPSSSQTPLHDHLLLPHSTSFPLLEKLEHPAIKGLAVWGIHPCEVGVHVGEIFASSTGRTEGAEEGMGEGDGREERVEGGMRWLEMWFMVHSTLVDLA